MTKWVCLGLVVLLVAFGEYMKSKDEMETFQTTTKVLTIPSIILLIACFFGFGMSLAALTNSNYC